MTIVAHLIPLSIATLDELDAWLEREGPHEGEGLVVRPNCLMVKADVFPKTWMTYNGYPLYYHYAR